MSTAGKEELMNVEEVPSHIGAQPSAPPPSLSPSSIASSSKPSASNIHDELSTKLFFDPSCERAVRLSSELMVSTSFLPHLPPSGSLPPSPPLPSSPSNSPSPPLPLPSNRLKPWMPLTYLPTNSPKPPTSSSSSRPLSEINSFELELSGMTPSPAPPPSPTS